MYKLYMADIFYDLSDKNGSKENNMNNCAKYESSNSNPQKTEEKRIEYLLKVMQCNNSDIEKALFFFFHLRFHFLLSLGIGPIRLNKTAIFPSYIIYIIYVR